MTTSIYKHKRLFYLVFWSILTFSLWPYVYLSDHPFYFWVLYTVFVMASFISISHYLSDIVLPKALKEGRMKHFLLQFFLGIILLNILVSLCFTLFPYFIQDEQVLTRSDVQTWKELFVYKLFNSIPSSMAIVTTTCGIRFYEEHHNIEKLNAKLQQEHLAAQIKLLQDQINPHLMFNVLNHIHILMQNNVELASTVLVKFSAILRYQLYESNQKKVFLHQEIQYLQDLVAIEHIRWQEELTVTCLWEIESKQLQIAPLLLVPLVENAFKHVSRLPHQQGYVQIRCTEQGGRLSLSIANSYNDTYKREKQQGGIGLANVTERLKILYPNKHTFHLQQKEDHFTVVLQINLTDAHDNR